MLPLKINTDQDNATINVASLDNDETTSIQ